VRWIGPLALGRQELCDWEELGRGGIGLVVGAAGTIHRHVESTLAARRIHPAARDGGGSLPASQLSARHVEMLGAIAGDSTPRVGSAPCSTATGTYWSSYFVGGDDARYESVAGAEAAAAAEAPAQTDLVRARAQERATRLARFSREAHVASGPAAVPVVEGTPAAWGSHAPVLVLGEPVAVREPMMDDTHGGWAAPANSW